MALTITASIDPRLIDKIEDLKRAGKLSSLINTLLIDYFSNQEQALGPPEVIRINTEIDVDAYLTLLLDRNPNTSKYGTKLLRQKLINELTIGPYVINIVTGERSRVFTAPAKEELIEDKVKEIEISKED